MGLCEQPAPKLEKQHSFGSPFSPSAVSIGRGIGAIKLEGKARSWRPAAGHAGIEESEGFQYPLRPSEPDCAFYIKTGYCKFGSFCRFNHPREKRVAQIKESDKGSPKCADQCKFYLMPGGCRFGEACRYCHSHEKTASVPVELNVLGLPVRPGKRECPHYLRTGLCKYSTNCKFHHPEPSSFAGLLFFGYQKGSSLQSTCGDSQLTETSQNLMTASNECSPLLDTSQAYKPIPFSHCLNLHMHYRYQVSRRSSPRVSCCFRRPCVALGKLPRRSEVLCGFREAFRDSSLTRTTSHYPSSVNQNGLTKQVDAPMQQKEANEDPNEPCEPESQNYKRYGGLKLALASMPDHLKEHHFKSEACPLSPNGLPLRPDQPVCIYYGRFGICKYGPACKFDHPLDDMEQSSQVSSPVVTESAEELEMENNGTLLSQSA